MTKKKYGEGLKMNKQNLMPPEQNASSIYNSLYDFRSAHSPSRWKDNGYGGVDSGTAAADRVASSAKAAASRAYVFSCVDS